MHPAPGSFLTGSQVFLFRSVWPFVRRPTCAFVSCEKLVKRAAAAPAQRRIHTRLISALRLSGTCAGGHTGCVTCVRPRSSGKALRCVASRRPLTRTGMQHGPHSWSCVNMDPSGVNPAQAPTVLKCVFMFSARVEY